MLTKVLFFNGSHLRICFSIVINFAVQAVEKEVREFNVLFPNEISVHIFLRNNDKQTTESTDFYSFYCVSEHYQKQQALLHWGL